MNFFLVFKKIDSYFLKYIISILQEIILNIQNLNMSSKPDTKEVQRAEILEQLRKYNVVFRKRDPNTVGLGFLKALLTREKKRDKRPQYLRHLPTFKGGREY